MIANDNDNIQAYHVRGKVSKVRFVTPASYADGSVFAVTGTWDEEQVKLVIFTTQYCLTCWIRGPDNI